MAKRINLRLSVSGIKKFYQCPRQYKYVYIDKRVPLIESINLKLGKVIHSALELLWSGKSKDEAKGALIELAADMTPADVARMVAMLEHYNPPREHFEVMAVEHHFEIPVINPETGYAMHNVVVHGFADGVLRDKLTGHTVVLEHKTTSEEIFGNGLYWQRLPLDLQVGVYALAYNTDRVAYDVLRKLKLKPSNVDRKAAGGAAASELDVIAKFRERCAARIEEAPEEWYQFRMLFRSPNDHKRVQAELHAVCKDIRTAHRNNYFPMHTEACRSIYGMCDYCDVCTGGVGLDDPTEFTDRKWSR